MTNEQKYKTTEERVSKFQRFCHKQEGCTKCAAVNDEGSKSSCAFHWLALEAEEEPEPCPFCDGETHINLGHLKAGVVHYWVDCISPECMYRSAHYTDKDAAISAHNRVARAVMAAKESEAGK